MISGEGGGRIHIDIVIANIGNDIAHLLESS